MIAFGLVPEAYYSLVRSTLPYCISYGRKYAGSKEEYCAGRPIQLTHFFFIDIECDNIWSDDGRVIRMIELR